ncbi:MAG TPA: sigma-70 family RNA polymerase sigma factor [Cellvibrionaceae bacterium]|nr:sigma-70 family RNA polymerase sigma factor [Cellvibrionaceae bacterium]HMW73863.1 sigma-70 family RNA polymerase sigma factor [Cellvibrionaceae bacterium]HMY40718.1 sigma-70 family RNA polymerase sigma factor [Marinagarivorans sp.]HNG58386.1 sigma-70 family RNA polymerase sigma factor [Cellvibrionaceae bacterium]
MPELDTANCSDAALAAAIKERDPRALHQLYQLMSGKLLRLALRITQDKGAAEEVVEDVFVHAWQHMEQWQAHRGSLVAWLSMLCKSRALLYWRQPHAQKWDLFADTPEYLEEGSAQADPFEWNIQLFAGPLKKAIAQLSPPEQQVLGALYRLGLTHEETAQATGLPLGTVKSHARRAMARLQQSLV